MTNDAPIPAKPKLSRGGQALVGFGAVDAGGSVLAYATGVWAQVAPWVAAVTTVVGVVAGVVRFWPWLSRFVKTVDVIGGLPSRLDHIDQTAQAKQRSLEKIDSRLEKIEKDDRIDSLAREVRAQGERMDRHIVEVAAETQWWQEAKPAIRKLMAREELGLTVVTTGPVVVVPERSED